MHEIIQTEDGSATFYVPELNEHYHSVHGAVQESLHIFIQAGIRYYLETHRPVFLPSIPLQILEAGFGTGLNAYLTLIEAEQQQQFISYHSLEKYPLPPEEIGHLNYASCVPFEKPELFAALHRSPWEQEIALTPYFRLYKQQQDFRDIGFEGQFDLVFFDAFNPDVQPHLWTAAVFERFRQALKPGGLLVTYCVKGLVKQALRQVGFTLKRLPGPPGKREMLRATAP